ncbi:E3 ubiquitin-protein ligase LRSAM1-like [Amphibalanus amphitrite]|uniref:E3 ubiquitin-protein ligase LRSAM1-like n=1 Tax=Amphibalanus amphitrite TaxID=1232801 RepID=UPI001C91333B|nr:E3 ubiquitin-protein ligase LRSAM1-like [Amphibalanus amphitrite]
MGSNVSKKRRKSSLSDSEARAKLQRKICVADETPEPVYDLSTCLMRNVPSGTYAKCKVLRKQQLLLQDNLLTSLEGGGQLADLVLLQVLRLDNNCLSVLSPGIASLGRLQVLNLSNNSLKHLPPALGQLQQLRQLICHDNALRGVPEAVGQLPLLTALDLRKNQLETLPALRNIARMSELHVEDNESLTSPPPEVVSQGSDAVIEFLCKEAGVEHTGPVDDDTAASLPPTNSQSYTDGMDGLEEKMNIYDKVKENKRLELLALERELNESISREGRRIGQQEEFKKQLLGELVEEQARLDADVARAAQQRTRDQRRILESVAQLESEADRSTAEVAAAAARLRDPAAVLARLEMDRKELEQLVTVRQEECDALRKHDVMDSMEKMMREKMAMENQLHEYQQGRDRTIREAISQDQRMNEQLGQLLEVKGSEQEARIQQLLKDETFQRQAFFNLYLQQDSSRLQILHQISEAEDALMRLTMVEANQRDATKESELSRLSEKRHQLTTLLVQLLEQQAARERELQKRLAELDEQRLGEVEHYWLVQYQRLLDSKPERIRRLEDKLEPPLKKLLQSAGAEEYLTMFANSGLTLKQVLYMDDTDLLELGVTDLSTRAAILRQTELVREEGADMSPRPPSAPAGDLQPAPAAAGGTEMEPEDKLAEEGEAERPAPSAPEPEEGAMAGPSSMPRTTHTELECVVCMDHKTEVIFLNCGHLCVCRQCAGPLSSCPMCRQVVMQKLVITTVL